MRQALGRGRARDGFLLSSLLLWAHRAALLIALLPSPVQHSSLSSASLQLLSGHFENYFIQVLKYASGFAVKILIGIERFEGPFGSLNLFARSCSCHAEEALSQSKACHV